jgi:predicted secreted protein
MQKLSKVLVSTLAVIAASACSTAPYSAEPSTAVPVAAEQAASHEVDGLWRHDKLVASTGQDIPL